MQYTQCPEQAYTLPSARQQFDTKLVTTPPATQLRNFTWNDTEALRSLLDEIGIHGHRGWPRNPKEFRAELEYPRVQPQENVVLADFDGRLFGYAIVEPEQNIGRSVIGVASANVMNRAESTGALLDWALKRASEFAPIAHLAIRDRETEMAAFVEGRGWKQVRKYLKLESRPDSRATAFIPEGFTVGTMRSLDQLPELTNLQNEAFKAHFGFSPNTEDEIRSRLAAPGASIDDVVMIHDGAERLVAYCWTVVHGPEGRKWGRIGMTGVLPGARGKGLGRAIAESGFNRLLDQDVRVIDLDVDSTNYPAIQIYSSLGFKAVSELDWWETSV